MSLYKKITIFFVVLNLTGFIVFSQNSETHDSLQKPEKKLSFAGTPKISYNRSTGFGVGLMGMMLFRLDTSTASPKSHVMVAASYTSNKSWFGMGIFQMYLGKDRWRITTGGGYIHFNFQTFYDTETALDVEIPYSNSGGFFFLNPLVKVIPHVYVGPTVSLQRTKVDFDLPNGTVMEQNYNLNSLGISANYDTRSNVYYPESGWFSMLNVSDNPNWFGNDSTFGRIIVGVNYYSPLGSKMILASRIATKISLGTTPFVGENVVGGKDIRGYTKGEYRGDQTYAIQTEFRWTFYKRLGMVGFAGIAMEKNNQNEWSPILPGIGTGLRFMMLPKDRLNIGVDIALGRNDWGLYFRIGEAF